MTARRRVRGLAWRLVPGLFLRWRGRDQRAYDIEVILARRRT